MATKKAKSPISKPDFFETKLNEKGSKKEKQSFTREQVQELLKKQIQACAAAIDGSNLSEYCAKTKIRTTKLVEI